MDSSIPIYRIINTEKDYIELEIVNDVNNLNDNIQDFNTAYYEDFILYCKAGSYWNKAYGYPSLGNIICFIDETYNYFDVGKVNFVGKYTFDVRSQY